MNIVQIEWSTYTTLISLTFDGRQLVTDHLLCNERSHSCKIWIANVELKQYTVQCTVSKGHAVGRR